MKPPRRPVRRNLPLIAVGLALAVVTWWTVGQLNGLGDELHDTRTELHRARSDNQVLSDQVRDLGGVPAVTPAPTPVPGADGADGRDGRDGRAGPPGEPGQDGQDGADGPPGSPGVPGSPGATVTGPEGPQGPQGERGKKGEQGDPGPACQPGWHQETVTVVTAGGPRETVTCVHD